MGSRDLDHLSARLQGGSLETDTQWHRCPQKRSGASGIGGQGGEGGQGGQRTQWTRSGHEKMGGCPGPGGPLGLEERRSE